MDERWEIRSDPLWCGLKFSQKHKQYTLKTKLVARKMRIVGSPERLSTHAAKRSSVILVPSLSVAKTQKPKYNLRCVRFTDTTSS